MTSRKLQYFDINGYAEAIRYMLHYGNLDFEDIRYKRSEWPVESVKETLPYGQMPIYEENGQSLNQSLAIARYVASQVGLMPSDLWEQARLDAVTLNVYDFISKLKPFLMEKDPEKKEENKKSVEEISEFFLSRFEKELKAGNGHFGANGKLNWADFVVACAIEILNLWIGATLEKKYPAIEALLTEVVSLPGVKEYVAKRAPYTI